MYIIDMSYRDYSTYYRTMHLKHYLDTLIHWKKRHKNSAACIMPDGGVIPGSTQGRMS